MKNIYILMLGMLGIFSSCEDFMDLHKEYIEGGEIIYAPKADSTAFIAGKDRILFKCWTYNSPNVKTIDLYWNEGLDSLIIPVKPNAAKDSFNVVLENMKEKSYTFQIILRDNFGHKSLISTNFGSSYSELYQSTLNDRRIKSIDISDKGGTIDWYSSSEGLVCNEVRYVQNDGFEKILRMPSSDFSLSLPNLKAGSSFDYRSLYIPEEEAIDTFYTAWRTHDEKFADIFKYDRSEWTVLSCSDQTESDGGGMTALLDDNLGTYWHSQWDPEDAPLPHWAVIDMNSAKRISQFDVYRRAGNTNSKSVKLLISNQSDGNSSDWTEIASGEFASGDKLTLTVAEGIDATKCRYLKILLPDSNKPPYTSIAEIYVYGK